MENEIYKETHPHNKRLVLELGDKWDGDCCEDCVAFEDHYCKLFGVTLRNTNRIKCKEIVKK